MESTGTPVVLSIAGSDSGGGAGIQADLRTFISLGVFGTTAVTCITAQSPDAVTGISPVDPAMVARQVETVCCNFNIAAAKTGMLYSEAITSAVVDVLSVNPLPHLVVDPVMLSTSGAVLLQPEAFPPFEDLLALATVVTPNIPEAEKLASCEIASLADMKHAAETISERYDIACVVKGGHIENGTDITNVLVNREGVTTFDHGRVGAKCSHGTGCMFSAAIASSLAKGFSQQDAVSHAGTFVGDALKAGASPDMKRGVAARGE